MTLKLISVFGSTGNQGTAVINSLLKNGNFKVRAFTRDPTSLSAIKLKELGCEVVKGGESDDKQVLKNLISGSHGVFLVTNFWAYHEKESVYGKTVADASNEVNVKHMVFSGLPPASKISNNRLKPQHFEQKYLIEQHIRKLSNENSDFKSTIIYTPFYFQNLTTHFLPKKCESSSSSNGTNDDTYSITLPLDPNSKFPFDLADINDLGPIVTEVFSNPSKYTNCDPIPLIGETLTGKQIADTFSKVTGKNVCFKYISPKEFDNYGYPGAIEDAFTFYNEYGAFHNYDRTISPLIKKPTSLEEYLTKMNIKLE